MANDTITPAAFIAARKGAHPAEPICLEKAKRALSGLNVTDADVAASVEEINRGDYVQRILASVSDRLPERVRELIATGAIAVGEVNEPTFDARTIPVGNGHAITINRGTHQFVYRIARILSTRFVPSEGGASELPFEETARILAEAFWWFVESGQAFGPEYTITVEQRQTASLLTHAAMAFMLCHELGHAVADQEAPLEYKQDVAKDPHLDEHGADVFGAAWALGLVPNDEPQAAAVMAMRYAGIEFVLQVWSVLERLGIEFADTHPRALERLALIRHILHEKCDEVTWAALAALAEAIEQIFARMAELLLDPIEYESFFKTQAEQVIEELDVLLARCATSAVPDYMTFYSEAGAVLARGYPERVLEHVAQISREFFADAGKAEPWTSDRVCRFHKFKLLVGLVMHNLNEPARSIFAKALQVSAPV